MVIAITKYMVFPHGIPHGQYVRDVEAAGFVVEVTKQFVTPGATEPDTVVEIK